MGGWGHLGPANPLPLGQSYASSMENWGSSGPCVSGFSLLLLVDRNCAGRQLLGKEAAYTSFCL